MQKIEANQVEERLVCARCESHLFRAAPGGVSFAAVCTGVAALFFVVATQEPLFEIHLLGRYAASSLFSAPGWLSARGLPELSVVLVLTLVVAPILHLGIVALSIVAAHRPKPSRRLLLPLGLLEDAQHWSMIDVFLLAALVCYVRLQSWTNVSVGGAIAALISLTLINAVAKLAVRPHELWKRLPQRPVQHAVAAPLIACRWCELVSRTPEGERCPRCRRSVWSRKRNSLARTSAYLLAAALMCVPANVLPVMDMTRFGRSESDTIFSGVVELTHNNLWGLAVLIFVASLVVPLIKIVVLAVLLFMTKRGNPQLLRARTRAFALVRDVGRWSLVDVYAVAILVSLVHMGMIANVLPGDGALAFCAVVILTMLAAESFDPRLMWDAAGLNDDGSERHRAEAQ